MSLTIMRRRVGELERGGAQPLYVRRWLGHPLTADQHAVADREMAEAQAKPRVSAENLSPELREWLFPHRRNAATMRAARTCA